MNQFRLDTNHTISAQYHCDTHTVKMPTEVVQQLCDGLHVFGYTKEALPWMDERSHSNHPATIWTRASYANWQSTLAYGFAVAREYQYRYGDKKGKVHKAIPKLQAIRALDVTEHFGHFAPTPFPLCMPPECRIGGVGRVVSPVLRPRKVVHSALP